MTLAGCFFTPHPPIMVPEVGGSDVRHVEATVQAMTAAAKKMATLAPDTIVLLSPHAPIAYRHMGVSLAFTYRGSLAFFRAPQVFIQAEGNVELATNILEEAARRDVPTSPMAARGDLMELDHGAMVPLVYLTKFLSKPWRLVLLSFSLLSVEEHVRFGEAIGEVLVNCSVPVVYVASGDLSHRLIPGAPAGFDPRGERFDRLVADLFAKGDWEGLLSIDPALIEAAGECGYRSMAVLAGVVAAARAKGHVATNRLLSYEGPFGVGYLVGEVEIVPGAPDPLVELARRAIEAYVRDGVVIEPEPIPGLEGRRAGVFVSLHKRDGSLRGCIGTTEPHAPSIEEEIVANAISAATRDPRFYPVRAEELADLDISVDVLTPMEKVSDIASLDPRKYGVFVEAADGRRGLLLPDLEGVDTVEGQLSIACRKAGIDPEREPFTVYRFTVERHH
ncbi:MAG: AmmeMemoRadiSam system protein A [Thermoleophilia bacterium]|nr:AmmeMemoRadiSam system protein A [Thermoleophilia bacterium]